MKTLLLASALFAGLLCSSAATPAPYHAFCKAYWQFASPCDEISTMLMQQIQAFNPMNGCSECLYTLVAASAEWITARHTSIDGLNSEKITFVMSGTTLTPGCRVTGISISHNITSLLDKGLNYCNLYNLLSASGLTSSPGFMEMINEWACLGYELATCKN